MARTTMRSSFRKGVGPMPDLEKVIEGLNDLRSHFRAMARISSSRQGRANHIESARTIEDAITLLKALYAFKQYYDDLYGEGLDVANYHLNGATEPFDSFYDSAMEEYENAKRADTQRDYQVAVEMAEYCERHEPIYNADDGSM